MSEFLYPRVNPDEKRELPKIDFRLGYHDRIHNAIIKNLENMGYEIVYGDMRERVRTLAPYDKKKVKKWIQEYTLFEVRIIDMGKGWALVEVLANYKVRKIEDMDILYEKMIEVCSEIHPDE